jgi:UDP-glucuronate 4-epimerase
VRLDRLIAAVGEAVGREPRIKRLPEQPGDVPLTAADVARAAEELGWRPRMPLVEGLRAYLAWEAQPEEAR